MMAAREYVNAGIQPSLTKVMIEAGMSEGRTKAPKASVALLDECRRIIISMLARVLLWTQVMTIEKATDETNRATGDPRSQPPK